MTDAAMPPPRLARALATVLMVSLACAPRAVAQSRPSPPAPDAVDAAVSRGLERLARRQNADGSFDAGEHRVAVTALCVMAFLANGHTPDVGRYGLVVQGGLDYLLSQAREDGYFGKAHGKGMYDQGIVTLALAEAYGVDFDDARRRQTRAELVKAVKVILDAQAVRKDDVHAGGWRYQPKSGDSDLSLSGWNALALRAAQDVGIDVPRDAVQKAVGYVLKCYDARNKGFTYQPGGAAQVGTTGIGVLALYLLDGPTRPELAAAADFLAAHSVNDDTRFQYYSMYYAVQAANQAGGAVSKPVTDASFARLLAKQEKDGDWPKAGEEPGGAYPTAMAVLTLSVPQRLLPVYQR